MIATFQDPMLSKCQDLMISRFGQAKGSTSYRLKIARSHELSRFQDLKSSRYYGLNIAISHDFKIARVQGLMCLEIARSHELEDFKISSSL